MKLTQKAVAALVLPKGKREAIYFDGDIPGFGVRLRAGGTARWIFQYRIGAKQRRIRSDRCRRPPLLERESSPANFMPEFALARTPPLARPRNASALPRRWAPRSKLFGASADPTEAALH